MTNPVPLTRMPHKLKFPTPELFAAAIDGYFAVTEIDQITQSGLCLHVGMGKATFYNYETYPEYKEIVELAKLRIENAYEVALREQGGAANIFALKNFGWADKQEQVISGSLENPLVTKIIREIVNVKQIEHEPVNAQYREIEDDFDYEL